MFLIHHTETDSYMNEILKSLNIYVSQMLLKLSAQLCNMMQSLCVFFLSFFFFTILGLSYIYISKRFK